MNRTGKSNAQPDGWIILSSRNDFERRRAVTLEFTVLLQPIASDALFAARSGGQVARQFFRWSDTYYASVHGSSLALDSTGPYSTLRHSFGADPLRRAFPFFLSPRPVPPAPPAPFIPRRSSTLTSSFPRTRSTHSGACQEDRRFVGHPFDKAVAMESYLRDNFTYTLNLRSKPGDDPLAHFLFETRAGHCEYFASAMAIMLRTLGIPSREVNGFLPGEYNDVAGDYIVRASDAHSWVEAYFPGSGWGDLRPHSRGRGDATGLFFPAGPIRRLVSAQSGTSGSSTTISRIRSNWRKASGKIPRIGPV